MKCCSTLVEHSGVAALVALQVTFAAEGSFEDVVTSAASDSFAVRVVEREPDTADYFHVAVWQVFVSSWVSMWELGVVLLQAPPPSDFHSSATFHDSSDEASELDCEPAKSDGLPDSFAEPPLSLGADSRWTSGASPTLHAGSVVSGEIAAELEFAAVQYVMIRVRVVGPPDSSKDVEAGVTVAVAVDDSEVFVSNEIVVFVEFLLEVCQQDLDSVSARNLFGPIPYGYSLDVEPM